MFRQIDASPVCTATIKQKCVCLMVLIIMLLLLPFPKMAADQNPTTVRVLLTTLQSSNTLQIDIFGNYTLNDKISFQRGSQLKVYPLKGQLMIHYEGMSYAAGSRFQLVRHYTDPGMENGLRLQNEHSLYTGDLDISINDNQFVPVLTIPIEEYLQGVVPYEMADDFPLEALNAQAISARTYTLKHLKPDKNYDLVDNTNDQVFRGIKGDKKNAIKAVKETAGIVCMYNGKLAVCLYTASNGGYTESSLNAWGREQIPYLMIQKDQYDLENPMSIVKKARISKSLNTKLNAETERLKPYLIEKVNMRLAETYKDMSQIGAELLEIVQITPHTSKYGGEVGVMRFLKFDLKIKLSKPSTMQEDTEVKLSGEASDGTAYQSETVSQTLNYVTSEQLISIDCPVFPDIEQMLSLSINRNENEIVSVIEEEAFFAIQFARYGHGVGMSQRGAEWMAKKYNWNYPQILRFYYPGTNLVTLDLTPKPLKPLDILYMTTPGPVPTPTLKPTLMPQTQTASEGQKIVFVTGVSKDSSLNLRSKPGLLSEIIVRLYYGQELLVLKELEDGWLQVQTDSVSGYVRSEFVSESTP